MVNDVINQAQETIDEIVPGPGFMIEAPLYKSAVHGG
jgi:hypothetical protein